MKPAFVGLFVLSLSQLCSAVDPIRTQVLVEFPMIFNDPFRACIDTPSCGITCFQLQYYQKDSKALSSNGCPAITPYSTSSRLDTLDYLLYPFKDEPVPCTLIRVSGEGIIYLCSEDFNTNNAGGASSSTTTTLTTTTTTTTPAATVTATIAVPTCLSEETIFGKKKGNGYSGDCCKTEADCKNDCVMGRCNGPKRATTKAITVKSNTAVSSPITKKAAITTTTTKSTTKTTIKATKTPSVCRPGYLGKKNGKGSKGACCNTHWDCKEECVKGSCN
ncbi:hypothetical protein A0J61_04802 [Choanephora cucurbitarum]|uniref:Uncharacterized protein n=1 Tax=Choanephora cucurbitarum TaxID=101091 RepID=A0A1C7NII2_9FUNG|nr:hypothetical protein A0J61_04802 [Choanephora cucurbitarum]